MKISFSESPEFSKLNQLTDATEMQLAAFKIEIGHKILEVVFRVFMSIPTLTNATDMLKKEKFRIILTDGEFDIDVANSKGQLKVYTSNDHTVNEIMSDRDFLQLVTAYWETIINKYGAETVNAIWKEQKENFDSYVARQDVKKLSVVDKLRKLVSRA